MAAAVAAGLRRAGTAGSRKVGPTEADRMAQALARTAHNGRLDWMHGEISLEDLAATINAIVLGYQLAINKTLGAGFRGLTQLLIRDLGDVVASLFADTDGAGLEEAIAGLLRRSGIAREVHVERHGDEVRVVVRRSLFSPLYRVLLERGEDRFTLSPEALLVAAIVARRLGSSHIHVEARLLDPDTIEIRVRPPRRS